MNDQAGPVVDQGDSSTAAIRRHYRAFICYSHDDEPVARRLHRELEGYRLPSRLRGTQGEFGPLPDRLVPIFRDREDLASAGELGPRIRAALADSEALVVVCSPSAAASRWVNGEVLEFKRLGRGHRIFCLIVDGEPGDRDRECFPPALRFELDATGGIGTLPAEPLAADLRAGGDGRSLARLKLLSGLLGVDLDTLRQREIARRHRRMLAVTSLAVFAMLVTSFLAVQAVIARHDAERRQKQAEALVDFMLGDLNDKLMQVQRLDILEAVDDRAMDYFQSLPVTDVTDASLEQRAKAFVKIGNVRRDQGHLPQAMASYLAATRISGPLAAAEPQNVARQLAHADNLAYAGTVHWYQGDLAGAQQGFSEAQLVLERARGIEPRNTRLLFQLATLANNSGHVLEASGRLEEAQAQYRRMLDQSRSLARIDPANVDWNTQLGLAHNNLAKMALLQGDLSIAVDEYKADAAIEDAIARRDPRDNNQAERLALSQGALGRTLALAGDLDGGVGQLREALAAVSRLHKLDPAGVSFQEDVALYSYQLAGWLRTAGDLDEATVLVGRAVPILQNLVRQDPANTGWRRELAEARTEQGTGLHASGKDQAAGSLAQAALDTLDPLLAAQPRDRATVLATVRARLLLAATLTDTAESMHLRRQALATLQAQTSGLHDPRLVSLQGEASQGMGDRPPPPAGRAITDTRPDPLHRP